MRKGCRIFVYVNVTLGWAEQYESLLIADLCKLYYSRSLHPWLNRQLGNVNRQKLNLQKYEYSILILFHEFCTFVSYNLISPLFKWLIFQMGTMSILPQIFRMPGDKQETVLKLAILTMAAILCTKLFFNMVHLKFTNDQLHLSKILLLQLLPFVYFLFYVLKALSTNSIPTSTTERQDI